MYMYTCNQTCFGDFSLQSIKEMGIMQKLAKKYLTSSRSCESPPLKAADIFDVGALFTLLVLGIGIALLILAGEILVSIHQLIHSLF